MRTLGIDLAARPERTAICMINWGDDGSVEVEIPKVGCDDRDLLAAMRRADAVGIDAPFGWPRFIVEHLPKYAAEGKWPPKPEGPGEEWLDRIRYRETDRFIRQWTHDNLSFRISPLSVSSDRIAFCAWRCAGLLHRHAMDTHGEVDRLGSTNGVFEVYPSVALAAWCLPHRGYKPGSSGSDKSKKAEAWRHDIIQKITSQCQGLELARHPELQQTLVSSPKADDKLDAFVSALVARAAAVNPQLTLGPTDDPQRELAREEGWIHVPQRDSLPLLVRGTPPVEGDA